MKRTKKDSLTFILSAVVIIESLLIVLLLLPKPKEKPLVRPPAVTGRIAVVLDDWGYNLNDLGLLRQIKYPLTLAILPNLPYTRQVAQEAHGYGFEVILHLPMEPHEKYRMEKNTILTSMPQKQVISITEGGIERVPNCAGVSNHMGSMATEDIKTMNAVFKVLKDKQIFFLDSFVTPKTVCVNLAKNMGVKITKRDIFLDNKGEAAYIRRQVYKLAARAKAYGHAVGIGHDRRITLAVLKEMMPLLEKEGYKFVFVSELAQ